MKYVAGLCFNEDRTEVALIRKNRPSWQAGKLNAIGGKIEENELPSEAMIREFFEETGKQTGILDWEYFLALNGPNFTVYFFKSFVGFDGIFSKTDEPIQIIDLKYIKDQNMIPNLNWIIPMALDNDIYNAVAMDLAENK